MQQRRDFISALLSLPALSLVTRADKGEALPTFVPGEKLTYSLGWQFIVAGRATIEVLPNEEIDGRKVRCFSMTAKTRKVVDHLFKVRDALSSTAELDVSRSLGYFKSQREGKTKRDVSVDFDWENMKAHYFEALSKSTRTIDILPGTQDPLSAFYFLRQQNLKVGKEFTGPITDGKRCKIAKVKVAERKTIKVNGRKYDALRLAPDIQDVGGVFEKSKNAKIEVWCTADHRHIPVLLKSKVAIGSFRAELETEI